MTPDASLRAVDSRTMRVTRLLRDSCIRVCLFGVTNLIPGTWEFKGGETVCSFMGKGEGGSELAIQTGTLPALTHARVYLQDGEYRKDTGRVSIYCESGELICFFKVTQ